MHFIPSATVTWEGSKYGLWPGNVDNWTKTRHSREPTGWPQWTWPTKAICGSFSQQYRHSGWFALCLTCQICPDISRYSKSLIITCVILSYISVYVLYHARGFTSDFPRTALGTTSPMLLARPARALRQLRHGDLPCDQMDDGVWDAQSNQLPPLIRKNDICGWLCCLILWGLSSSILVLTMNEDIMLNPIERRAQITFRPRGYQQWV